MGDRYRPEVALAGGALPSDGLAGLAGASLAVAGTAGRRFGSYEPRVAGAANSILCITWSR